jgi:hypothetical protein
MTVLFTTVTMLIDSSSTWARDIVVDCGRIRTIPVSIANAATGEKVDECPQPALLGSWWNAERDRGDFKVVLSTNERAVNKLRK